ncbi:TPA: LacI family DNA-binding transcriptional regulator [Listeria monocytogenes]|nr:LacI family transcriptional regulator [Listeria monocytogenes]EAG8949058.1 LacI family transcriptional regulator [Listeria monocytogenes]EAH1136245.1 LacI family transcriptional regulator [Listeria monocytogenes]EAH2177377.1 LacI family transcriptional regulator [Listeria monocytogenes]EAH2837487.1 LacI family transcriptional regulator [Listeria monocytogenes]
MASTIYDIAKHAGVSKSTVSRVLNNQANISEESRKKVLEAIDELNYQPSKLARALTSSGFDAIMVISNRSTTTTTGNPFFSEIIQSISTQAELENFDLILQTAKNSEDELKKCLSKIQEKMIKGIIMLSSPADEDFFYQLDPYNIPIVVTGKVEGHYKNIYSVDTDNFGDSYALTKHLIKQGHQKIACIHAPLDYHVSIDRLAGFRSCLFDHQLDLRNDWIIDSGYSIEDSYKAALRLMEGPDKPTAVFATDDLKVLSIYKMAADKNLQIPADFSVIGYNDKVASSFLSPPLTSIDIPINKLGKKATNLLFRLIHQDKNVPKTTIIKTEMIERESIQKINV